MTVGRICQRNLDTAQADESVRTAAQRMGTRNVGTLVVLNEFGRPVGILTDRDVAVRVVGQGREPYATIVGSVMTENVETVSEDVPISSALSRMRSRGVRRLPVTNAAGDCVGMVSLDDILTHLAKEFAVLARLLESSVPGID
jgi:CBS domain-containing protein